MLKILPIELALRIVLISLLIEALRTRRLVSNKLVGLPSFDLDKDSSAGQIVVFD